MSIRTLPPDGLSHPVRKTGRGEAEVHSGGGAELLVAECLATSMQGEEPGSAELVSLPPSPGMPVFLGPV